MGGTQIPSSPSRPPRGQRPWQVELHIPPASGRGPPTPPEPFGQGTLKDLVPPPSSSLTARQIPTAQASEPQALPGESSCISASLLQFAPVKAIPVSPRSLGRCPATSVGTRFRLAGLWPGAQPSLPRAVGKPPRCADVCEDGSGPAPAMPGRREGKPRRNLGPASQKGRDKTTRLGLTCLTDCDANYFP